MSQTHPGWVKTYGDLLWLDPGEPGAVQHSLSVILDVVRRYDVDAVHLDDYFYPYPIREGNGLDRPFPDQSSWERAVERGETRSRADWRRSNVDDFVRTLYEAVKREKPWVKVGISPFGIWRPGYPPSVRGFDAFEGLYADARKWLSEGWVDYLAPQLYWPLASTQQGYRALLEWWIEQNAANRHIWVGNFASRTLGSGRTTWTPQEIVDQVTETRSAAGAGGNIHFSMKALMGDLGDRLADGPYKSAALIPASDWMGIPPPAPPSLGLAADLDPSSCRTLKLSSSESTNRALVRARSTRGWSTRLVPMHRSGDDRAVAHVRLPIDVDLILASSINRAGVESTPVRFEIAR
jgi:hypothetical protein